MTTQEIAKKLRELQTTFDGFAGYYGLRNYDREKNGKRKSNVDAAKYDAYGYCADQIGRLLKEIGEGEQ